LVGGGPCLEHFVYESKICSRKNITHEFHLTFFELSRDFIYLLLLLFTDVDSSRDINSESKCKEGTRLGLRLDPCCVV